MGSRTTKMFTLASTGLLVGAALWLAGAPAGSADLPSFGEIEYGAVDSEGLLILDQSPDYVSVLNREGEIAGYVRAADLRALEDDRGSDGVLSVFNTDLELVGHMVPDRGFVPLGIPFEEVPNLHVVHIEAERVP